MNIFKKKSSQQGCIVIIGTDVEALSQAFLPQAQRQKLALYQVRRSQQGNTLQFETLDQLTDVKANLIDSKAVAQFLKKLNRLVVWLS